jgi:hypothetical protein
VSGTIFCNLGLVKFRNRGVFDSANWHNLIFERFPGMLSTSVWSQLVICRSEGLYRYRGGILWLQRAMATCRLICFTALASVWCKCQWILPSPVILGWCQTCVGQGSNVFSIPLCPSRGYRQFTFCCYHQFNLSVFYHPSIFWLVQYQCI